MMEMIVVWKMEQLQNVFSVLNLQQRKTFCIQSPKMQQKQSRSKLKLKNAAKTLQLSTDATEK